MPSLPDLARWLQALAKTPVAAALALGCWAVLSLAELDLLHLPSEWRAGLVVGGILAAAFVIVPLLIWIGNLARDAFRRWSARAQLDHLSRSEEALLRHQVERNEQTFSISLGSPAAAGLRSKGLLKRCSPEADLQGGHLHAIPDFVWRELKRRWPAPEQPETRSEDVRSAIRRARAGVTGCRGASDRARRI